MSFIISSGSATFFPLHICGVVLINLPKHILQGTAYLLVSVIIFHGVAAIAVIWIYRTSSRWNKGSRSLITFIAVFTVELVAILISGPLLIKEPKIVVLVLSCEGTCAYTVLTTLHVKNFLRKHSSSSADRVNNQQPLTSIS
ncbi:hypothetical protein T440DRAFT_512200, partial [Plenodomus tracheiphilus IPT5]